MSGLHDGPVVDAHRHFRDPAANPHPWLRPEENIPFRYVDDSAIERRHFPSDYFADAAGQGVVETVYVEAEWKPTDPIGKTRFIHELAGREGVPNAMVAQAWLHHDDAADVIAAQAAFPLVHSVRHKPGGPASPQQVGQSRTLMSDERWRQGYEALQRHGLHFDQQTPWWNLPEAARLARDFPQVTRILSHTGLLLLPFGWLAVRIAKVVLAIPQAVIMPALFVLAMVGVFAIDNDVSGVVIMACLGVLGYLMEEAGFPIAPIVLGIVLGKRVEPNLMQSLVSAQGNLLVYFERPISAALGVATLGVWGFTLLRFAQRALRAREHRGA